MNRFVMERQPKTGKAVSTMGQLVDNKFSALWKDKTLTPAKVSIGVSQSADFGAIKVSATVTLSCDQNEKTIDKAGELAYHKAYELMMDGWSEMEKAGGG